MDVIVLELNNNVSNKQSYLVKKLPIKYKRKNY